MPLHYASPSVHRGLGGVATNVPWGFGDPQASQMSNRLESGDLSDRLPLVYLFDTSTITLS